MMADLSDLAAFVAVARSGGFRDAARTVGGSPSSLSEAVRRLETKLGVRLLNRTTRSVAPTEAGAQLLDRLGPALGDIESALDVVNRFRDRPAGTLRLNVPVSAARLVLPHIVPRFLATYPEINLEVIAEDSFVDMLAAGCDAVFVTKSVSNRIWSRFPLVPVSSASQRQRLRPISIAKVGPSIRATYSLTRACEVSSRAARCRLGSSNATERSSK
jgi:DNA-binding transcriptional LysR family regulator